MGWGGEGRLDGEWEGGGGLVVGDADVEGDDGVWGFYESWGGGVDGEGVVG